MSALDSLDRRAAALFEDMREAEIHDPAEIEKLVASIVSHLRSWKPESVTTLSTLPEPTEPATDPRGGL